MEVVQALPIVHIPQNGPLREHVGRIRVADIVGHWPRQQLPFRIQLGRTPCNGGSSTVEITGKGFCCARAPELRTSVRRALINFEYCPNVSSSGKPVSS